jgi:hypothetical protein
VEYDTSIFSDFLRKKLGYFHAKRGSSCPRVVVSIRANFPAKKYNKVLAEDAEKYGTVKFYKTLIGVTKTISAVRIIFKPKFGENFLQKSNIPICNLLNVMGNM